MTMNVSVVPRNQNIQKTVVVGTPLTIMISGINATVNAIPGGGGTLLIQYTVSPQSAIDGGTAHWYNWPSGTVSAATQDTLIGAVKALKCTATTANGTVEVCQ